LDPRESQCGQAEHDSSLSIATTIAERPATTAAVSSAATKPAGLETSAQGLPHIAGGDESGEPVAASQRHTIDAQILVVRAACATIAMMVLGTTKPTRMLLNRDVVLMPEAVPPLGASALGSSAIWWVRS
jgi:hypothetical protein